jgi:hypothetical protein
MPPRLAHFAVISWHDIRMPDTYEDASEAARALIARRWGPPGSRDLNRAVQTVVERRADLDDGQRAVLETAITPEDTDDD